MDDENFDGGYSDSTIEENDTQEIFHNNIGGEVGFGERERNDSEMNENVAVLEEPLVHQDYEQHVREDVPLLENNARPNPLHSSVHEAVESASNENQGMVYNNPNRDVYIDGELAVRNNVTRESDDIIEVEVKTSVDLDLPIRSAKRSRDSEDDDDDDADSRNVCPICMDNWTNAGEHRIVCLKCGHLFGESCIVRWLDVACSAGQRRCPQCNETARKKDIRRLFVHSLKVLDTSENEKLKKEMETMKEEKRRLEMEEAKLNLKYKLQHEKLQQALSTIKSLECRLRDPAALNSQQSSQPGTITRLSLEYTLEISNAGGCRVMTCNSSLRELYVSHSSTNTLFSGFSMRKIDMQENRPMFGQCVFLHTKAIRDLAVRPQTNDLLLSVSLDKSAKLLDLSSNTVINKFVTSSSLWSCCWDKTNLNRFFVGSQNGSVHQYDSRQPNAALQELTFPGDLSPVTSLASLPYCAGRTMPQGGLLVSKLVSCWAYTQDTVGAEYKGQQLPLEGPFTSLCYDKDTNHVLVSRRPNSRSPNICHMVCQLDQQGANVSCNVVHNFAGGTAQMQLSRPCFAKGSNGDFVSAYVESRSNISVWSLSSGQLAASVKAYDPVKDICPLSIDDKLWFAALSEKTLRFYCMT